MNEVTGALLPALIPDTLLPQTPSRALPIYPISARGDRVTFIGDKVYRLLPLRDKTQGRERLPSRTQPCSSPAVGCTGAAGNQASPPDCGAEGSIGKLSDNPACGTELSPNPRTQFSTLLPFVLTAWRAWKGEKGQQDFPVGGVEGRDRCLSRVTSARGSSKIGKESPTPTSQGNPNLNILF